MLRRSARSPISRSITYKRIKISAIINTQVKIGLVPNPWYKEIPNKKGLKDHNSERIRLDNAAQYECKNCTHLISENERLQMSFGVKWMTENRKIPFEKVLDYHDIENRFLKSQKYSILPTISIIYDVLKCTIMNLIYKKNI